MFGVTQEGESNSELEATMSMSLIEGPGRAKPMRDSDGLCGETRGGRREICFLWKSDEPKCDGPELAPKGPLL